MPQSDLTGISHSTASAALALTALSAGSEDRNMADPVTIKNSPPFQPPLPPPNVYQIPGYSLHRRY
jgi:hypothetical protein